MHSPSPRLSNATNYASFLRAPGRPGLPASSRPGGACAPPPQPLTPAVQVAP